jgi:RNA recognition motif-containing protein
MQGSKLYVGNLSYSVTNEQLEELFANQGTVNSVNIIEGKGFGFVEMSSSEEAQSAMDALNNTEFAGRPLKIDEARPQKPRRDFGDNRGRRDFHDNRRRF